MWRVVMAILVMVGLGGAGCGDGDGLEGAAVSSSVPDEPVSSSTVLDATTVPTVITSTVKSTTTTIPTTTTSPTTIVTTATTATTATTSPSSTTAGTEPVEGVEAELTITITGFGDAETALSVNCPGGPPEACERLALDSVRTRLVDGPPRDEMCTMQFGSAHQAQVVGTLDGKAVKTTFARNDGCAIHDWDNVMAGILPAVSTR